jgi:3-hydroxyacyl-CoA dehydrogenase
MKLLEVIRGEATANDVLATAMALARRIGKIAVLARVCDGFIGNRMIEEYGRQAGFLLEEGCLPQQVDTALERVGFPMGPFRMNDLVGNDIPWKVRQNRYRVDPSTVYSKLPDILCEKGRLGQKTGAGWYDYPPGNRKGQPSAEVNQWIVDFSAQLGIKRRNISDATIVDRLVLALVNEAAKLLGEGIAQRASDIDVVYVNGYGFPRAKGGPLFYADSKGLPFVLRRIGEFAGGRNGEYWQPAPLLRKLVAEKQGFFHDPR